jgi:integration host factor subunit beta
MTKADLITVLSRSSHLSKGVSEIIVETIFKSMSRALDAGEKIELRGFGSFRVKIREARTARNPKTGQKVHVGRRKVPSFRVGKELVEAINGRQATS